MKEIQISGAASVVDRSGVDYQFATSRVSGVEAIYDLNLSRHL